MERLKHAKEMGFVVLVNCDGRFACSVDSDIYAEAIAEGGCFDERYYSVH